MNKIHFTKYLLAATLAAALLVALSTVAVGAAYGEVLTKTIDAAPFIFNGRTYDTTRPIAETFGIYVAWDQENQRVTLSRGMSQVIMTVGSSELIWASPDGQEAISIDAAPMLRDGRVFLPVRFWAELFGLSVYWNADDGSVTVSEGAKTLWAAPGSNVLILTGGHFLKLYNLDESFLFYYPEEGIVDINWDGYAEILLSAKDETYVISAVNATAGLADPIRYTAEEIGSLIDQNALAHNLDVLSLPQNLYGVPAFRVSGTVGSIPQAGVVFLKGDLLCGLTIEVKTAPGEATPDDESKPLDEADELEIGEPHDMPAGAEGQANGGSASSASVDGAPAGGGSAAKPQDEAADNRLKATLAKVNAILDEIMASFVVF
jgi:hypothetical protein